MEYQTKKVWSLLVTEKTMLLHGDVIIKLLLLNWFLS